jgi:hypothetical protein
MSDEPEISDDSALLKYYLHKVVTRITSPKMPATHDSRARKARRQAKCE